MFAVGYALTFVYFETRTIIGELAESSGVGDFFSSQLTEFMFRFASESIMNFVKALMWPVYVIQLHPMWGGIALGLGFVLFDKVLKKPVSDWLMKDD